MINITVQIRLFLVDDKKVIYRSVLTVPLCPGGGGEFVLDLLQEMRAGVVWLQSVKHLQRTHMLYHYQMKHLPSAFTVSVIWVHFITMEYRNWTDLYWPPKCDQRKLFQFGKLTGGTTVDMKDRGLTTGGLWRGTQLSTHITPVLVPLKSFLLILSLI